MGKIATKRGTRALQVYNPPQVGTVLQFPFTSRALRPSGCSTLHYFAHSDAGLVRIKNQDAWKVGCSKRFFALADGIGGRKAGDVAAQGAVNDLCEWMERTLTEPRRTPLCDLSAILRRGIEHINGRIYEKGCRNDQLRGMGTTLCSLYIDREVAVYAHVGDSRIYHWRGGQLRQLTQDHTKNPERHPPWCQRVGSLPKRNPHRNILTRAIGVKPYVLPALHTCRIQPKDRFLLCSDGLSDVLPLKEIERDLSSSKLTHKLAKAFIDRAKDNDSRDNITAVLIEVDTSYEGNLF